MPEMSTAEIYEAFGFEAPSAENDDAGNTDADNSDAEIGTENDADNDGETSENPEDTPVEENDSEKQQQTAQERRENAARRREAEKQAAINDAVNKALADERARNDERWKAFFKKANLENTITGEPITNMDEFNAWSDSYEREQLEFDLQAGKLTPEALQKIVDESPVMQQAKALLEQSERQRQMVEKEADNAMVQKDLAEIHAIDPSINTVADLLKAPWSDKFKAYVERGNTFIDAYYLANRESVERTMVDKAREQAASNIRSKQHLQPTGNARGSGAAPVPSDVMEYYRELNPNATEAEIQAHWQKSHHKF